MDLTSLKAVIADLRKEILPSRFENAQQPDASSIQIALRTLKGLTWLEFSWSAEAPRLVQIESPSRKGSKSTLAKQLQHCLKQMALVEIRQKGFERVVEFCLATRPGESASRVLVLELMGRHSNLLLLDETKKIITLGRQVRDHQSRFRPISTGDIYTPPPPLQGIEPNTNESFERWRERLCLVPVTLKTALQQTYQGISPSLAIQLANEERALAISFLKMSVNELSDSDWQNLFQRWFNWLDKIEREEFELNFNGPTTFRVWNLNNSNSSYPQCLSITLGKYYQKQLDLIMLNKSKKELQKRITYFKESEEKSLLKQRELLKITDSSKRFKEEADQLLCKNLLDKEMINKAQSLYSKSKKLRRSVSLIKNRINYHLGRIKIIEGSESFLEETLNSNIEDYTEKKRVLNELKNELDQLLVPNKIVKKTTDKKDNQLSKPIEIISPNGILIQIGRNHRQNELISMRQSKRGDIWLHAQECPGSHVILKASLGLVDEIDIKFAADLAALFSRAKGNLRVPVVIVPVENLQRIPNSGPGIVTYKKSTVLWGEPRKAEKSFMTKKREITNLKQRE